MFRKLFNFYSNACKPAQYNIVLSIIVYVMISYLFFEVGDYRSILSILMATIIKNILLFLFMNFLCEKGLSFLAWVGIFIMAIGTLLIFGLFSTYLFSNKENKKMILQKIFGKKSK